MTQPREWFQDESLSDEELLARCNREFRRGPVGLWSTYGDHLTLERGFSVVFAADGLGVVYFWDVPYEKDEIKTKFTWRSDNDFEVFLEPIEPVDHSDRWGGIRYALRLERNDYRIRVVRIVEIGSPDQVGDEVTFWWNNGPLNLLSLDTSFENLPGEDV